MKSVWVIGIAASLLVGGTASLLAQDKPTRNTGGISMKSVEELNQKGVGPEVIGGKPAKSSDWPASFYSSADGARCTSTLVGPRALLLAAHCVGNGERASIVVKGQTISGRCTHAPDYKDGAGDDSADYALCRLDQPVLNVKPFETVNIDPTRIKKGDYILLTGYGCTQAPTGGGGPTGGNDGIYRTGKARIVALPGEPGNEPNTILTRDTKMVCPGDSGGGAYIQLTASKRFVASVNSRVLYGKGQSYLSSLSSTDGLAFLATWSKNNGGESICGINLKGTTCR